ncbi:hypothetical protein KBB96_07915 [Luteolibacter ambystomatis]|uniref:Uncharacterized protein n=1 Tax=Luteolibacter ambystomatis TaxID=2824561 RepID=A0A975PGJ8_9BACT|nr:hypothetical protein [Luteolibacter ambystomatis]QUE52808.1 hypothetical protein KBB96_07915 [Luteolibacter ambystomatis]
MNTKPDDVTLALWLEDELDGDEFARVEAWASTQPDQLAAREETRHWRKQAACLLPREEEPPYADFFNSRIRSAIASNQTAAAAPREKRAWWRAAWFMPATAAAGMALAFWGGTRTAGSPGPMAVASASPVIYTPDSEVQAKYYAGNNGSSTVIVLDGVSAIPDTLEFLDTASISSDGGTSSTASNGDGTPAAVTQ